jgi:hypothetical protein
MANSNPLQNGRQVDLLYRWLREDVSEQMPNLIKKVIANGMWQIHQFERTGEIYRFEDFIEFVETEPPSGLGSSIKQLLYVCRDDKEALDMIDQVMKDPVGKPKTLSSIRARPTREQKILTGPARSAIQRGLRILREKAKSNSEIAKLRDKVLSGDMTVNAALIEAGLRVPRTSIPIGDVETTAKTLRRIFTGKDLTTLIAKLKTK